ncbi:interleukin-17D [Vanacampus margaritifer]
MDPVDPREPRNSCSHAVRTAHSRARCLSSRTALRGKRTQARTRTRSRKLTRRECDGSARSHLARHTGKARESSGKLAMPPGPRVPLLLAAAALLLLLLAAHAAAVGGRVRKKATRSRSCLDLPEEILEQMFGRLSVGVLSAFHHALQLEPRDRVNLSCPGAASDGKSKLPVNLLSVSPWAYRISYDPSRYPRHIPEAYCLCKGCLTGPRRQESQQYRSTPVYAPSVVLRRSGSCVGGRHSYSEVYVSVAVGCTCVPLLDKDRAVQNATRTLDSWRTAKSKAARAWG